MSEENKQKMSLQEMFDRIVEFNNAFGDVIAGFAFTRSTYRASPDKVQFLGRVEPAYKDFKALADKVGAVVQKGQLYDYDTNFVYVSFIYNNIEFGSFVEVADYENSKRGA